MMGVFLQIDGLSSIPERAYEVFFGGALVPVLVNEGDNFFISCLLSLSYEHLLVDMYIYKGVLPISFDGRTFGC